KGLNSPVPAYGGEGGGNCCVVKVHRVPRRGRSTCSSTPSKHFRQCCLFGNSMWPQVVHLPPTSVGPSARSSKSPSATGTCPVIVQPPLSTPGGAHPRSNS